MSIVSNAAADGYIARFAVRHQFYLVHGSDEGLTHERTRALVRKVLGEDGDPLRLVRLDGEAIAGDPGALADEAYAISMFGPDRTIWIDARGRDLLPALRPLFAKPPRDCIVIVRAGQLRKDNALRTAFEDAPNCASIECYSDEPSTVRDLIKSELQEAGLLISPDDLNALSELLGADRQTTRAEIAKLMLYAFGQAKIRLEDIEAIVSGAAPSKLDAMIDHALLGDLGGACASAAQFFNEGGDGDQSIARLAAQLVLLHRVRLELGRGKPFDAACRALFLKLPPASSRALARQSKGWTSEAIMRRLPSVRAASANVRAESRLSELLATRMVWSLASLSKASRGQGSA